MFPAYSAFANTAPGPQHLEPRHPVLEPRGNVKQNSRSQSAGRGRTHISIYTRNPEIRRKRVSWTPELNKFSTLTSVRRPGESKSKA